MTYRLKHPRISSAFVEVDTAKQRDAHVSAGWVLEDGPRRQAPEPEPVGVEDDEPRPRKRATRKK